MSWRAAALKIEIDEVKTAQLAMNDAFQGNDKAVIEQLTAPDQVSVLPYFKRAVPISEILKTLGKYKVQVVRHEEMKFTQLGPGAIMVGQDITFSGTVDGKPVPGRVYATAIWVKINGNWRQKFYQETALD